MPPNQPTPPGAPAIVERFVKQLNVAFKAVKLYPLSSSIPRDNGRVTLEIMHDILQRYPEVRLEVAKEGLFFDGLPVYPGQPAFMAFAREFYNRGLADVRFHAGTTTDELLRFLSLLDVPVDQMAQGGGFEDRLWELGVNSITVREVATRIVEAGDGEETDEDEEWPPPSRMIDEILAEAFGRRPRAQRLLARLIADKPALTGYLASPSTLGESSRAITVARRVSALARAASAEGERAADAHKTLADATQALDAPLLREVLLRLLVDARTDSGVMSVLRSVSLEQLCTDIIEGASFDIRHREELARTIRNLISLGLATRQETMMAADIAMAEAGASQEIRNGVLEDIQPSHLRVRERRVSEERPGDMVLRLLRIASDNVAATATGSIPVALAPLAEEAARGITDGDVFGALVTVVTLDERPDQFASVMAMLENNLGLLIERHDFDIAADAAEALVAAEARPTLDDAQRQRLRAALQHLARPEEMRIVTSAMRVHRFDTPEHEACRRLLAILGEHTISSLLEVLADEKDMANRKALVDMISGMADKFIPELGARLADQRWYFVRNVVGILGATRSADALPYLERTLRHSDARVRRETIRAITGMKDALAGQMLVAALSDDDAGNVQLAARYLGTMRTRAAVPALEEVARGEGRGNRDADTRIDAIEALGRIGAPESAPVLESIARQRGGLRAGRSRELRQAATGALAAIKAQGGGAR